MSTPEEKSLPEGWASTTLGRVFKWGSGGTPARTRSDYFGGDIPWAIIGDLTDGMVSETASSITELGLSESSAKWVSPYSVLIAMYGSIGKLGINTVPLATNQAIAFTQPAPISTKYLFHYLSSRQSELINKGKGGTQSNISQTVLKAFPFLVAPLPEQHRIVEALDSYLSRLDDATATLERVQRNLERYRASVLKSAVEGRLVPTEAELARAEGRDYEPASVLLDRILAERRRRWEEAELAKMEAKGKTPKNDKWKAKYKEPVTPEREELPELPEGWCWGTVDQVLSQPLANGRSVKTASTGFPVLRLTAIKRGGVDLNERKIGAWTATTAEPYLVREDDFLVARGNGSIRRVGFGALVGDVSEPTAYPDTMIRIRLSKGVAPAFFSAIWNSRLVRRQLERKAKTTAGIFKVNQRDLEGCVIPIPPLTEQGKIAEIVASYFQASTLIGEQISRDIALLARLRQSILKWAFEGKLVDQDPDDEPASVLLDRIRAEREAAKTKTERRKKSANP